MIKSDWTSVVSFESDTLERRNRVVHAGQGRTRKNKAMNEGVAHWKASSDEQAVTLPVEDT